MNRKLWLLMVLVLISFNLAEAQQPKRISRIGYLSLGAGPAEPEVGFRQQLLDLGWIENQNIAIEYRWAAGKMDRLAILAEELVRLKVDIVVSSATPAIQAAKNATATIPIVSCRQPVSCREICNLAALC